MPQKELTEWLKIMVAEINRKKEEAARAHEEEVAREGSPTREKQAPRIPAKAHP